MSGKRTIVASQYVSDYKKVQRGWLERLFTFRPSWRPFAKFDMVKDPTAFISEDGIIYVSYETFEKWKQSGKLEEMEMLYEDEGMDKKYPGSGNC